MRRWLRVFLLPLGARMVAGGANLAGGVKGTHPGWIALVIAGSMLLGLGFAIKGYGNE